MKNKKTSLILWIIFSIVFIAFFAILVVGGIKVSNDDLVVVGALGLIAFIPLSIWEIISHINKLKKSKANASVLSQYDKKLLDIYASIKDDEYNDVNYVSFANEGLKFSAKGKYGCIKDFNGKPGHHLAFSIEGTKMVEKPDDYDDVVNYEDLLFLVELGYFEGFLLSTPENDNGIIVEDVNNLQGKTIQIKQDEGYFAYVHTAESDEIAIGEIKFVEWNENSKIIKFKLLVDYGLSDVVVGTVKLTEDKT